ncbi:MAG: hypothetical protein KC478_00875 [Bacteriovoracaceae bacterium]|nr:hypothetical protein [Bacteriovoracaceae bacterium]
MSIGLQAQSILDRDDLDEIECEQRLLTLFGIKHNQIEQQIDSENPDHYVGLDEQAFSTSFRDYYTILSDLDHDQILVDLGAGYCKGTLLSCALKLRRTVGLEVEAARVEHAKNIGKALGLNTNDMKVFNLLEDQLPLESAYYIYLPLSNLIFKTIETLLNAKHSCTFYVVESHGDVIDFFDGLSKWFRLEKVLPSSSKRHKEGIYKYRFNPEAVARPCENSYELIYWIIQNYSQSPQLKIEKENASFVVSAHSLIPIKYNGQMMFECLSLKRIVDFQNVKLFYR